MSLPVVKRDEKGIFTLYVNDQPFFLRSGELHNSSASSLEYMKENVWPFLRDLHLNSVILPVYWELLEKEEGAYDYSLVDGIINQAREEKMKLVFLWFGLWKNAESMYVPGWMKKDSKTYFRAVKVNGEPINTISPLCSAAVDKDRQAFTALMKHIREIDSEENTVVAIQVENEIGLLGTARDYGEAADKAFAEAIPAALSEKINKSGTWKEVFGTDAEEAFMAWYFASAVETIASSGKAEYDLPCYANAWLKQYPWYAGSYPSGGPVHTMHAIWKAAAPSLFTLGPDIYVADCARVMDEYQSSDNPLFIPEIRKDAVAASYALYAFGAKDAICFSPFGIEELGLDPSKVDCPPMEVMIALNIDPSAFDITDSKDFLAQTNSILENLEPLYLQYRGTEHLQAFVKHQDLDFGTFLQFEDYDIAVGYDPRKSGKTLGSGIVIELEKNRFLLIGASCSMQFKVKPGVNKKVDFVTYEEGRLDHGQWIPGRVLNGDEKMSVRFSPMPEVRMIELFTY